jgi:hypothetical protein
LFKRDQGGSRGLILNPGMPVPVPLLENEAHMESSEVLSTLILCGFMGALGQGVRAAVGLKSAATIGAQNPGQQAEFDAAYFTLSLMIGFTAGILAGLAIGLQKFAKIDPSDPKMLLAIIAAGYAGTDFIENAFTNPALISDGLECFASVIRCRALLCDSFGAAGEDCPSSSSRHVKILTPARCACPIIFAVPRPPGKANTIAGLPSSSICLLRIGPAARPCLARRELKTRNVSGQRPSLRDSIGTNGAALNQARDRRLGVQRVQLGEHRLRVKEISAAANEKSHCPARPLSAPLARGNAGRYLDKLPSSAPKSP